MCSVRSQNAYGVKGSVGRQRHCWHKKYLKFSQQQTPPTKPLHTHMCTVMVANTLGIGKEGVSKLNIRHEKKEKQTNLKKLFIFFVSKYFIFFIENIAERRLCKNFEFN